MPINYFQKFSFGNITRKIVGPYAKAILTESEEGRFLVHPQDSFVGLQLRRSGKYNPNEIDRLKPYINETTKILVVGAHIGALVIPLSRLSKEVIAIEANPRNFELLELNVSLNGVKNCTVMNFAASDKEETIPFLLGKENTGGSKRVPIKKDNIYYYDSPDEVSVHAYPLESKLDKLDYDIVIMDIEGSEYFALKGMQSILKNTKVLVVEYLPHALKNVAGVDVRSFLDTISPHFSKLKVESLNLEVNSDQFFDVLNDMYQKDQCDDGLIFMK
tara:strand:+ start:239 stop:1060 length:822 start_codon:yes stop_codon:yes gene_type:complete